MEFVMGVAQVVLFFYFWALMFKDSNQAIKEAKTNEDVTVLTGALQVNMLRAIAVALMSIAIAIVHVFHK